MLNENDRNHLKALCEQLEKAQVEVAVLLHNTRLTIRNLEAMAEKLQGQLNVAGAKGLAQDSTLPCGVE